MYDNGLAEAIDFISDFRDTASFLNELLLVEEGRAFFDGYAFGYPKNKPLRFVQDNYKPISVYDDDRYVWYREHLEKLHARRDERARKRRIEEERQRELELEKQLKKQERQEKYRRLKKEREREKKRQEKLTKDIEKELKKEYMKRMSEPQKSDYDPLFPPQNKPVEKTESPEFEKLREKYAAMFKKPGHEKEFLISELECEALSAYELKKLCDSIWPKRTRR